MYVRNNEASYEKLRLKSRKKFFKPHKCVIHFTCFIVLKLLLDFKWVEAVTLKQP